MEESNASDKELLAQQKKIHQIKKEIKAIREANFQQVQNILHGQQKIFNQMHEEHKKERQNFKRPPMDRPPVD